MTYTLAHVPYVSYSVCARVRACACAYLFIYLIIIVKLCKVLYRSACNLQTIRTCILYEK